MSACDLAAAGSGRVARERSADGDVAAENSVDVVEVGRAGRVCGEQIGESVRVARMGTGASDRRASMFATGNGLWPEPVRESASQHDPDGADAEIEVEGSEGAVTEGEEAAGPLNVMTAPLWLAYLIGTAVVTRQDILMSLPR